jgi:hypothetical protein
MIERIADRVRRVRVGRCSWEGRPSGLLAAIVGIRYGLVWSGAQRRSPPHARAENQSDFGHFFAIPALESDPMS